jgi:hypothetical protein
LNERVEAVKTERDIAQVVFDRAVAEVSSQARVTQDKIDAFVEAMRSNVRSWVAGRFRSECPVLFGNGAP